MMNKERGRKRERKRGREKEREREREKEREGKKEEFSCIPFARFLEFMEKIILPYDE